MTTTYATLKQRLELLIGDKSGAYYQYYMNAINEAARQVYPDLKKRLLNQTLITGNVLPNSHFEDWVASTSYPDLYTVTTATAAKTSTAGLYRGPRGTASAKVTASAADGYMSISSNTYPKLLDLMNRTVTLKTWAYPEVADDAFLTIYTLKADGTAQTLNSTTTCPAGYWTLLKLEDQTLNDDLVLIQIRFRVHTNLKYAYFDNARLISDGYLFEYFLPDDFKNGTLTHVREQTTGLADQICDDLYLRPDWEELWGWDTRYDGTYKYLVLNDYSGNDRGLELEGYTQLEDDLDADADTFSLDNEQVTLFLYKVAKCLYEMIRGTVSSDSTSRYDYEVVRWESNYLREKHRLGLTHGTKQLRIRNG